MANLNLHDYHEEDIVNAETHHEKSDVNVRALFVFGIVFVIFAAVSHGAIYIMYRQFIRYANDHQNKPLTMMERPESMIVPATPRLQPFPSKVGKDEVVAPNANTPVTDMVDMRKEQDNTLNSYGYADREKGVVHMPIEDAKKLALQKGFAPMSGTAATPANPVGGQAPSPVPPAQAKKP